MRACFSRKSSRELCSREGRKAGEAEVGQELSELAGHIDYPEGPGAGHAEQHGCTQAVWCVELVCKVQ